MPTLNALASKKLADLEAVHLKRSLRMTLREDGVHVIRDGKRLISFSCNDYLGLTQHPQVKAAAIAAIERYGTGAGASRLVTGNHPLYGVLEEMLAQWKGEEACLVFGSGYLANLGLITALAGAGDCIIADKLVHACMVDGAKLSGAKLLRFKHNDMNDCRRLLELHRKKYTQCLLLTEGIFSMDGDRSPLLALLDMAEEFDATLLCDDAHVINHQPLTINSRLIRMGTLSKALGAYGGYVCGPQIIMNYAQNAARTLVYSTALPPSTIAAAIAALSLLMDNPELAAKPQRNAEYFTKALGLPETQSPIVPIIIGDSARALEASALLEAEGFLVSAIRPPTVPPNTARLRVAFSALHTDAMIEMLAAAMKRLQII